MTGLADRLFLQYPFVHKLNLYTTVENGAVHKSKSNYWPASMAALCLAVSLETFRWSFSNRSYKGAIVVCSHSDYCSNGQIHTFQIGPENQWILGWRESTCTKPLKFASEYKTLSAHACTEVGNWCYVQGSFFLCVSAPMQGCSHEMWSGPVAKAAEDIWSRAEGSGIEA